jgi:hypothetical protein
MPLGADDFPNCEHLSAGRIAAGDGAQTGLPGEHSEREPPDTIPNSEVKPLSADDSVVRPCESRTSPGIYLQAPAGLRLRGLFISAPNALIFLKDAAGALILPLVRAARLI